MHSFSHNLLPILFNDTWVTNRECFPERELRDAEQLFTPAHNYFTLKRLPLFKFPTIWNAAGPEKNNPVQHRFMRILKRQLLSRI
jgi:hypothetical protein